MIENFDLFRRQLSVSEDDEAAIARAQVRRVARERGEKRSRRQRSAHRWAVLTAGCRVHQCLLLKQGLMGPACAGQPMLPAQRSAVLPPGCLSTPFSRLLLQAIVARLRRRELYKYVTDALIPQVSWIGQLGRSVARSGCMTSAGGRKPPAAPAGHSGCMAPNWFALLNTWHLALQFNTYCWRRTAGTPRLGSLHC